MSQHFSCNKIPVLLYLHNRIIAQYGIDLRMPFSWVKYQNYVYSKVVNYKRIYFIRKLTGMKYGLNSLFCTQNVKSFIGSKNSVIWTITAVAAKSLPSCPTVWSHRWQPTRLLCSSLPGFFRREYWSRLPFTSPRWIACILDTSLTVVTFYRQLL